MIEPYYEHNGIETYEQLRAAIRTATDIVACVPWGPDLGALHMSVTKSEVLRRIKGQRGKIDTTGYGILSVTLEDDGVIYLG